MLPAQISLWLYSFKWTTVHDAALVGFFGYIESAGPLALLLELGPDDFDDVQLVMRSDAD